MRINSFYPVIWTENFEETLSFYTHVLDFSLLDANKETQWAFLEKNGVEMMITQPNSHEKYCKIGFSGSFYFKVNKVENFWEKLKTKAKICYEIETFEWGMREFAIYDNNGYILQFGESVDEISREE